MTCPVPRLLFADLDRRMPVPGNLAKMRPGLRMPIGELVIKGYLVNPADVPGDEAIHLIL